MMPRSAASRSTSRSSGNVSRPGPKRDQRPQGGTPTRRRIFSWDEVDCVRWDDTTEGQILSGREMRLIRAVYPPGSIYEMHSHPHEQFSLLLSGRLQLTVGNE